jgi:gliding motility-associated-like protein
MSFLKSPNQKFSVKWMFAKSLRLFLVIVTTLIVSQSIGQVSLTFSKGYIGTQGSNTNQANNIKNLSSLGIARVSFGQSYAGTFGGTQGNDLSGTIKIYLAAGATSPQAVNSVITLTGALNWRETSGSTIEVFGFIFDVGQSASITFNSSTLNITGGSASNSSSSLGLKAYASTFTFTDGENRSGNAATNGLLTALNAELSNSPQPSTITLTNASVVEGNNLVYTVALSSATSAGVPQVYTFLSSGTASSTVDYNSTYTFSNGVVNNGDGTITVPGGVSSFTITVATIDDATIESTKTLILSIGSKSATGNILDNDAVPTITTTGTLNTFVTCSGCTVSPQSFSVTGQYLTNDIVVTAPTGFQISTNASSGYASSITLTQTSATVSATTIFARLTNNATTSNSGVISVTSTGATAKTITVTTNTDNALNLDGASDIVTIADNNALDLTTNYTIEAWIKPTAFNWLGGIVSKYHTSASNGYILRLNGTGDNSGISFDEMSTSNGVLSLNKWQHIAAVNNNGTRKIYINGVEQTITGTPLTAVANTDPVIIGQDYSIGASRFFNGSIDEVRIWNTARSASEISTNMNVALAGNETGLVAYYNFDQGIANGNNTSITTLKNKTSNSLDGAITGVTLNGTASNFVDGFIPSIVAAGNVTTITAGSTVALSNMLTGGVWSSSNTSIATVNSTGVVTGVAAGTVSVSYTICGKTVSYNLNVTVPTITVSGTLSPSVGCFGVTSNAQSITVSATSLTNNLVITAPAGYELSTTAGGSYSTTISLTPSSGTVTNTSIFVRLSTNAFNGDGGKITLSSVNASTVLVPTGLATVSTTLPAQVTIVSSATSNTICVGEAVTFTATAVNGGITPTYQWKLNGTNVGVNSATYTNSTLNNNDVVSVIMTSSIASCVTGSPATSNAITINVNSVPATPTAIAGLNTLCLGSNAVYTIPNVTGATSYEWVITGNITATTSTSTALNTLAGNTAGAATVKVRAVNACGVSAYTSDFNININNTPAPTADFTLSNSQVCVGLTSINFTNTSVVNATTNSPISSYTWDFGDGSTAVTTQNASRTYTNSGNYNVILTIQSADNCYASISKPVMVDPLSVPGTAAATDTAVCVGSSTTINLTGSTGAIQWMSTPVGTSNWTNIVGATSNVLNTGTITASTNYMAVVRSGVCTVAISNTVTVTAIQIPSVTVIPPAGVGVNDTTFSLSYIVNAGNPNAYSLYAIAPNPMPNFVNNINYALRGSPLTIAIPPSSVGNYTFSFYATQLPYGCSGPGSPQTFTLLVGGGAPAAPAALSYTSPNVYPVGSAISPLNPSSTGGPISSYSISPGLPAGLTFNTTTGVISGTPTAVSSQTSYVVTGTNSSGTVTATVVITVVVAAPATLSYTTPNVYTVGNTITPLNPTATGGPISSYSITPGLPAGLIFNTTTGVISGTPSAVSSTTSYVVTGTNVSGTVTATLVITVNVAPPASLSYTSPNVYTKTITISPLNPSSTGGPISSYTISPGLPAGLIFNTTTGVISGTPSAVSSQTSYVVTGTNTSGTVTATVVITVINNAQPPAPPTVQNGRFIFGRPGIPTSLSSFVGTLPSGIVPVWCNGGTLSCATTPPAMPTLIGRYIYQVRSYDTLNQLYSNTFVNDTIVIAPPPPTVVDSTYVLGVSTNPSNIGVQVAGLSGASFSYFYLGARQTGTPALGTAIGTKRYAATQTVNSVESDTAGFNVTILDPNAIIHLQKIVYPASVQPNSSYNYPFTLIVTNLSNTPISNVVLTDNLRNSVPLNSSFSVISNTASGGLRANASFNGNSDINVTLPSSTLNGLGKDSAKFVMNLVPNGYSGTLSNIAYVSANTKWGTIVMQSSSNTSASPLSTKTPTTYLVSDLSLSIPEGFSPNYDGVNDYFVIIKPYNVTIDIEIFNRWGGVVYSNRNYNNDWNGKGTGNFAGQDLVDGGYYYSLRAVDNAGNAQIFKGYVIIQR